MRSSATPWSRRLGAALFVVALVGSARQLVAQDPYIKIREPREWQDGRRFIVPAGRMVRISGGAWHPAGVRQILINGTPVTIEPDPPLTNFEYTLTADNQSRTVTIVIVPSSSQRFEAKFAMAPSESAAPATDTTMRAAPPRTNVGTQPGPVPRQAVRPSGFKKRGLLYAAGAVAGGVLTVMTKSSTAEVCTTQNGRTDCVNRTTSEASYRPIGLGLIGVSVVAGIIDFSMSSRNSRSMATLRLRF